jgi:uncharacterized protein YigA (DUF484 family)
MFTWIRRTKKKGPQPESVPTQLKIIRTHIAAMTSEMSTLRVQLGRANDQTAVMLERLTRDESK